MALEGKDFFRHLEEEPPPPPPPPPKLEICFDCLEEACPAWGFKGRDYCRNCAPRELKYPSKYSKDFRYAYPSDPAEQP
jgi:hypothetical protein